MQKAHNANKNNYWVNYPDVSTPIVQDELNRIETSIDTIDDRVVLFDTTKADQTDMLQAVKTIAFDRSTGVFTITFFNSTTVTIDTDLEKVAVNFDYDDDPTSEHYESLILTLIDGTVKYIDLSALITQYEFLSTSTIQAVVGSDGSISFNVIDGSITESKLEPNFLANCRIQVSLANGYAEDAEAWAVGTRDGVDVPSTDETYQNNAKYYAEYAEQVVDGKQDALIAGNNITISGTTISATDTTYADATQSVSGLMSANDKTKLDGLSNYTLPTASASELGGIKIGDGLNIDSSGVVSATAATITIDSALSSTSENPVQNKVINSALGNKQDTLTAGSNISISDSTISATDTTYTAGTNVSISSSNVISATDTTYTAGSGLSLSSGAFSIASSGVTTGTYGPSAAVTGTEGTTISVPYFTVNAQGRITAAGNRTLTNKNTTYSAGTGLSLSGTTINHADSITAGTAGTSSATSGSSLAVPYVTYNATGHITATGTHTHTITATSRQSFYTVASGGTFTISTNTPYFIVIKCFSAVYNSGALGYVLGGYDAHWLTRNNITVSRSGTTFTLTESSGANMYVFLQRLN